MKEPVFNIRHGFARQDVTLANWRQAPFSTWSFQHVAELVPSVIRSSTAAPEVAPASDETGLLDLKVDLGGFSGRLGDYLSASHTDLFTVMKSGIFLLDWAGPYAEQHRPHIVFSISKSLTAIVAGVLEDEGMLSPEAPVTDYLPEAARSAFGRATVRHLLDMTTHLDFDEAYLAPESLFSRYRQAMAWNPGGSGENLLPFLCSLQSLPGPYGDTFRYRSPNTDILGVVLERASGERMADLLETRLWQPLCARGLRALTMDREGTGRAAAGISATARDLARVGEMMRLGGTYEGRRILPEAWVLDTTLGGDRGAWARGDFADLLPGGCYRNQWYQSGSGFFCGIGIHGQWLVIDPASETVIVKLSSQPAPVQEELDATNLALFRLIHQHFQQSGV